MWICTRIYAFYHIICRCLWEDMNILQWKINDRTFFLWYLGMVCISMILTSAILGSRLYPCSCSKLSAVTPQRPWRLRLVRIRRRSDEEWGQRIEEECHHPHLPEWPRLVFALPSAGTRNINGISRENCCAKFYSTIKNILAQVGGTLNFLGTVWRAPTYKHHLPLIYW